MAATSTSTNYSIVADSMDCGGAQVSSANYTSHGSLGGIAGLATVTSPSETVKSGYVGQLFQITGLELAATFVANGETQQLDATQTLDDGTTLVLVGGTESWSVLAGQIPAGLTLNTSSGVISGIPTGSGAYSFTILVSDGVGDSAQQTFSGTSSGPTIAPTDTPTMPPWGLTVLGVLFLFIAAKSLSSRQVDPYCRMA